MLCLDCPQLETIYVGQGSTFWLGWGISPPISVNTDNFKARAELYSLYMRYSHPAGRADLWSEVLTFQIVPYVDFSTLTCSYVLRIPFGRKYLYLEEQIKGLGCLDYNV